jgi:hypothetical protein
VQVGVIADEALVPDPAELIQAFEDEFDTLKVLASMAPGQPELPPEAAPKPEIQRVRRRSPRPKAKPKAGPPAGEEKLQEPLTEGPIMSFQNAPLGPPPVPVTLAEMASEVAEEAALV